MEEDDQDDDRGDKAEEKRPERHQSQSVVAADAVEGFSAEPGEPGDEILISDGFRAASEFASGFPGGPDPSGEDGGEESGEGEHPIGGELVEDIEPAVLENVGRIEKLESSMERGEFIPVCDADGREDSEGADGDEDEEDGGFSGHSELVDQEGDAAFEEGSGAGEGGDGEHEEEESSPEPSESSGEVVEGGGEDVEDQPGAGGGIESHGEDGGEDGEAGHHCGEGVEDDDPGGGLEDVLFAFEVTSVSDGNSHAEAEGVKRVAERFEESGGAELGEIGFQEECDSSFRSGEGYAAHDHGEEEQEECWHEDSGPPFDAVADAAPHHECGDGEEDEVVDGDSAGGFGQIGGERVAGFLCGIEGELSGEGSPDIFDDPAADDGVVGEDEHRRDGAEESDRAVSERQEAKKANP